MNRLYRFLFFALFVTSVQAQDYPTKPIRILVPYPPGGVTDVAARLVGAKMSESLGQPIIVENQPAAGGVVATNSLARMAPDGYTLGAVFDSFATNPFLSKGVTHNPITDFAPISLMVRSPQLLVVHPGTGIKTISDLIARGRDKDKVFFSIPGAGTSSRLSAELLKTSANMDITLVSYRGGAAALNDLLGGQVTGMIVSMNLVWTHVQSGKLVALGVSSSQRNPLLKSVPAISEVLPGFEVHSWSGMVAPAGTPKPILDKLHTELVKALAHPDVREKLTAQGAEVVASTPGEFAEMISKESNRWGKIIRDNKITAD
jgi:tripartite-type tricarboxylate transporter receptor subunit TctC